MSRVLLVEDDPMLGEGLKLNLELEGYDISWARTLKDAMQLNDTRPFELVLLDLGLPDGNGLDFCRHLRTTGSRLPMIILTAQADEDSVVEGFATGATDYVKKPFSNKELVARIKATLREPIVRDSQIRFGKMLMLIEQRRVMIEDVELQLNRREFDLLRILANQPGAVITRTSMIERLDSAEDIFDRTIDSHISHIRAKLKKIEGCDVKIKSEYGVGYRLVKDD